MVYPGVGSGGGGGALRDVAHDLKAQKLAAGDLGLQLNHFKSEIICRDHSTKTVMLRVFPDLSPVSPQQAILLGSPIGGEEGVNKSISEKTWALDIIGGQTTAHTCA